MRGERARLGRSSRHPYVFTVAAGILPAVEPGILPGGLGEEWRNARPISQAGSGRQDAALYGSQDGCRYMWNRTVNTYGKGERESRVQPHVVRLMRGHI